jgi:hypothetical protein
MENQTQKQTDEIDLIELFQRIGKWINGAFNKLLNLLYFFILLLIRKSIWIFSFAIIGIAIGLVMFSSTRRYYTAEMIMQSNSVANFYIINSINQLNELFKNRNSELLLKYLKLNVNEVANVKSIQAAYGMDLDFDGGAEYADYEDRYNPKDTTIVRLTNIFFIKVEVYDESVFESLKEGTKRYILNNPFILQSNEIRLSQTKSLIESYNIEINKLDSLQKSYYYNQLTQKAGNSQMLFLNEKEVKLFHNDLIELLEKKLALEKSLLLNPDPITVVQDFTPLSKQENPWTQYVKTFVLLFASIGLILSLLWQYRRRLLQIVLNKPDQKGV